MTSIAEFVPLLPIVATGLLSLVLMVAVAIRRNAATTATLTVLGLAAAFVLIFLTAPDTSTQVTPLFIVDSYALFYVGMLLLIGLLVALLSVQYFQGLRHHRDEYYMLLVLATLGTTVIASASHFMSVFLGLELLSVSVYGMIAYLRRRAISIEAGVKYLILAAVSSAFLLFGMALIYARLGTMELARMAELLSSAGTPTALAGNVLVLAGLGMMVVGFGFKLAIVPFHMWTPDVYQGAPAPVTAFVATASKGAVMALLLRFASMMNFEQGGGLWLLFSIFAVASMFLGNLLALHQQSLKRLLAYSSIAHLGYVLVAFLAGGPAAGEAVSFYLLAYAVTSLGAFGVITALSRPADRSGDDDISSDLDDIEHYRGLSRRRPWLAGILTVMLFSLAGIPLTAGFVGKFLLLSAGAGAALWTLVLLLAVNSALGIYYYLRVVVAIYLRDETEVKVVPHERVSRITTAGGLALGLVTVLVIILGVFPHPVMRLVRLCCESIF